MNELVSIIIPTYNRMSFLGETLDSVLNQTYKNLECIVVDDGGSDYTNELMQFYCERFPEINYYKRPDDLPKGVGSCRNYGFDLSKGEFVMWLDDDDVLGDSKLEKQIEVATPGTNCLITCSWGRLVGKKTNLMNYNIYKDYHDPIGLLVDYAKLEYFPSHVFLVSRHLVKKAGYWDNNLKINDDGVFFAGIIINASEIKFASGAFVFYRGHTYNNTSKLDSKKKALDLIRSWDIIESMIPVGRKKEVEPFIYNIRRFVYRMLKEARFRSVIIKNVYQFHGYIIEDCIRKTRELLKKRSESKI